MFVSPCIARLLLWVLAQKCRLEFSPSDWSYFCCISEKAQITNSHLRVQKHNFHCQIKKGLVRHDKKHFMWASWTCSEEKMDFQQNEKGHIKSKCNEALLLWYCIASWRDFSCHWGRAPCFSWSISLDSLRKSSCVTHLDSSVHKWHCI